MASEKITKDICFGMMLNLLCQIRDNCDGNDEWIGDITANPDMEKFDDYSIDEVIKIANGYLDEIDGDEVDKIERKLRSVEGDLESIGREICSKDGSARSFSAINEAVEKVGDAIHNAYLMRP